MPKKAAQAQARPITPPTAAVRRVTAVARALAEGPPVTAEVPAILPVPQAPAVRAVTRAEAPVALTRLSHRVPATPAAVRRGPTPAALLRLRGRAADRTPDRQ